MSTAAPMPADGERGADVDRHGATGMITWPDRRILDLFGIDLPIVQAPMAGAVTAAMVAAVSEAGGLGSLPCATLTMAQIRAEFGAILQSTSRPVGLNFFCHTPPVVDAAREAAWRRHLAPYYAEFGLDPGMPAPAMPLEPFGAAHCDLIASLKPEVVSFHFGLPDAGLCARVKQSGAQIISSATTVEEAVWLERNGCDAIIAQGWEAGGHRAMFLSDDVGTQLGTLALVPQIVDAVSVPVIAAGGIADGRGVAAALALGASAAQVGTAYLFCPEASLAPLHRQALKASRGRTAVTRLFSGRPARAVVNRLVRELGARPVDPPDFPLAGAALAPLRSQSEPRGSDDFTALWCGQAAHLGRDLPAGELTRQLAEGAGAAARLR